MIQVTAFSDFGHNYAKEKTPGRFRPGVFKYSSVNLRHERLADDYVRRAV